MKSTLAAHRTFFWFIGSFAAWVAFFGVFWPAEIQRALPWPVPLLHARFIGAFYLSGAVILGASILAKTRLQVRTILIIAGIWTGWLLVVTLLHWDAFDFGKPQTWFWLVAYVVYPIVAAWLFRKRPSAEPSPQMRIAQPWVAAFLWVEGALLVALAAACFLAPAWTASIWPWKISTFLTQVYSGPALAYGVGALVLAARRNWEETLRPALGMTVFALFAILGSLRHLALFTAGSPSEILWFTLLGILSLGSAGIVLLAIQSGRR